MVHGRMQSSLVFHGLDPAGHSPLGPSLGPSLMSTFRHTHQKTRENESVLVNKIKMMCENHFYLSVGKENKRKQKKSDDGKLQRHCRCIILYPFHKNLSYNI